MRQEPRYGVGPLQREMSEFHCRELLFAYSEGLLSSEAAEEVEQTLRKFPALQQELEALRRANAYLEQLSSLQLDPGPMNSMLDNLGLWTRFRVHLNPRNWPDGVKIASEAMLLLVSLFMVGVLVPWDLVKDKLDIFSATQGPRIEAPVQVQQEEPQLEASPSEEPAELAHEVLPDIQPAAISTIPSADAPTVGDDSPAVAVAENDEGVDDSVDVEEGSGHEEPEPQVAAAGRGEVYKLFMNLSNLDVLTPEIADRIRELGGAKAGQVPLGWRRTNGSYFHFSIDENNYEALQTMLKEYGSLRVIRDAHSRVMPKGVRRMILWIERVPTSSQPQVEKEVPSGDNSNKDEPTSTLDYE